jgi:hypothetical protein
LARESFFPLSYFCPEEITSITGEPCATELPLAGSWLNTLPVATAIIAYTIYSQTIKGAASNNIANQLEGHAAEE